MAAKGTPRVQVAQPKLVTVPRAAEILSISSRSAWRLLATRQLEAVRIGGATRVTVASIEALIQRGGAA